MSITIHTLWATRKSEGGMAGAFPELLVAWDEYSRDENQTGFIDACDEARDAMGDDVDEWRAIDLTVSHTAIEGAFEPDNVEATVNERTSA